MTVHLCVKPAGPLSLFHSLPGTGALLLLIVALVVLVLGTPLYSVLGIMNGKVNSGVPVKWKMKQ